MMMPYHHGSPVYEFRCIGDPMRISRTAIDRKLIFWHAIYAEKVLVTSQNNAVKFRWPEITVNVPNLWQILNLYDK